MAAKAQQLPQDNTGSAVLSQIPPTVDPTTSVLASSISLPEHPLILFSVFECPPNAPDVLDQLEVARRAILARNHGKPLLESLLPCVHISKDVSTLYVFTFGSTKRTRDGHHDPSHLGPAFETLHLTESSSFTPAAIYPCSDVCSSQAEPCERCLVNSISPQPPQPLQLLPRASLRLPLTLFLQAVRDRLIDDVAEASKLHPHGRFVTRLKGGFLLGPVPFSSDWGSGWENHAHSRPLIFCNLQVHMSYSTHLDATARLVVHPIMRPTYYLPLRPSLPLPAGTPVIILPHGVPAYYLSTYCGPSAALTGQFEDALTGLGAGDWKREIRSRSFDPAPLVPEPPRYVVVWLAVQNKQGEDKGMPVIWPAALCVSYHVSSPSTHARTSLPHIPELPAQLQASPPPPAPTIPAALSFSLDAPPSGDVPPSATTTMSHDSLPVADRHRLTSPFLRRPTLLRSSSTSDSLRAFRTLSLSRKPYLRDVKRVAMEVSGYVDSVVKERERERERIRKDRQEQEIAAARAKLAEANPQAAAESPAPPVMTLEPLVAKKEEVPDLALQIGTPSNAVEPELVEPESHSSVDSDHSGDSLFSPPDAPMDLPSTEAEEEPLIVGGNPSTDAPAAEVQAPSAPLPAEAEAGPSAMGFDPFNGFDGSWGQQSNGYMDMNIDYDLDFGMNIDEIGGTRAGGAGGHGFDMDDNMPFTDDDFDFFNAPSSHRGVAAPGVPPVVPLGPAIAALTGPTTLGLTPLIPVDGTVSGPGPPSATAALSSPWTSHLADAFTPKASVDMHGLLDNVPPPDLIPPSPTRTTSSHSAPATPAVHLADSSTKPPDGRKLRDFALGVSIFDPIPFASSHREADGKYAVGKFALPSPPAEQDRAEPLVYTTALPLLSGWKYKYSAATDPRVGVVRKLIGVKRKSVDQGTREQRATPIWESYREPEAWQSSSPPPAEADSEDDSEDEPSADEEEVAPPSAAAPRTATPPPSYLPLGPTLLRTHFHHAHLLPLCGPLRPPGLAANSTPGAAPPISAPTPVSPAAILGAATEKTKSLEGAAQILIKEVVENPVWLDAWRANASLSLNPPLLPAKLWQSDARFIQRLMGGGGASSNLQSLFAQGTDESSSSSLSLRSLEPPMLLVGKGETVIQMSATSLRFWEKLGLTPRAGPKDVTAFVFFEGADEEREVEIEDWLQRVSSVYSSKNFGAHVAGISSHWTRGLVPTRFDTLRKTLMSFESTIPTRHPHVVFYIVTPSHIISSSSTTLRQILSAVRRFYKARPDGDILVHFVPETLISGTHTHPASSLGGLDTFVCSVYDRILQPVSRAMSRKLFDLSVTPVVGYFEAPAFSLIAAAPSGASRTAGTHPYVTFTAESSASSLDVTHRHMLLHVGYQVSSCGRWILAACVDGEGEAHELKAWLTPDENVEQFLVSQVWTFGHEFARRANIEWRIVISKLGLMGHSELDAWVSHLSAAVSASADVPPLHVTLLAVDNEHAWTLFPSSGPSPSDILKRSPIPAPQIPAKPSRHAHTTLSDVTCTTHVLSPPPDVKFYPAYSVDRPAKGGPCGSVPGSSESPFIPDLEEDEPAAALPPSPSIPTEPLRVPEWSMLLSAPSGGAGADAGARSMLRLFRLHVTRSLRSTYELPRADGVADGQTRTGGARELMGDVARSFHDLAVLARTRWRLRASDPALPFHLAACEVMRAALSGGAADP